MTTFEDLLRQYIIHKYANKDKKGKLVEVAIYSLDQADIKFRIIKFVDNNLKEAVTTENKDEAFLIFENMLK